MLMSRLGTGLRSFSEPRPTDNLVENISGAWRTLGYWIGVFAAAVDGRPTPDPVIEPIDCSVALNSCVTDKTPKTAEPYDPKSASLTGPALAADALRKAGFPADEIPTFVAIAKHETGFRNVTGPTVGNGTMRGMWQLNDAYWRHDNWQDPYANAVKAKEVRDESVQTNGNPYYPWSTWRAAVRDAGDYAQYGDQAPVAAGGGGRMVAAAGVAPAPTDPRAPLDSAPESFTPDDPCVPSGQAALGVTIGSWNVLYSNSSSNVTRNAGFADLVGLQEIRDKHRPIRVPGYSATPGQMAVPIIWRKSTLDLISWKREDSLRGFAKNKSVVWGIWEVKATGQRFGAVNTHQLVQGGTGWDEQAVKVNQVRARLQARGLPVVLVGDMNASPSKVAATFGGNPARHHIDYVIGFGVKPAGHKDLGYAGSDHRRVMAVFGATSPTKTDVPVSRGAAGIRAIAKAHGANPITAHTDPQGMAAFDLMLSGDANTELAEDLRRRHDELGLRYVISQMRIASEREDWVWRDYSPITSSGDFRHTGHVHVSY